MGLEKLTAFEENPVAEFHPLCGWAFQHNINPGIINTDGTANGGTVTHSGNEAVLNSGSNPAGVARIETVRASRYIPGVGGKALFTSRYSVPQPDSHQIIGPINELNGWGFGYLGTRFGIVRRSLGVDSWFFITDQGRELGDVVSPQFGTVFGIRYQWLGYGVQRFYVENNVGELGVVTTLLYSGKNTVTSIDNPNIPLSAEVRNLGNTTPLIFYTSSGIAGLEGNGMNDALSVNISDDVEKAITAGTNRPLISLRQQDLYYGKKNHLFTQLLRITLATISFTKAATFRFYVGGTVTGGSWAYINEPRSPVEVNKTFTSFDATGAVQVGAFPLGKDTSQVIDLVASFFRLYAEQQLTVVISSTGAGDAAVGLNLRQYL